MPDLRDRVAEIIAPYTPQCLACLGEGCTELIAEDSLVDCVACGGSGDATGDLAAAVVRAVRAALLEELADEEHAAGWGCLIEWRHFFDAGDAVVAIGWEKYWRRHAQAEAAFRRRAAAERGNGHG